MARAQAYGVSMIGFSCRGCGCDHVVTVNQFRNEAQNSWDWNRDLERPTFRPSILVNRGGVNPEQPVCHSYVTDGRIQFLSDSTHALAGQTVDLPEWGQ